MRLGKKIFDTTAVIAFLHDMSCPECIVELSRHCEIFVPEEVADEVTKQPGRQRLQGLISGGVIKVVRADRAKMAQLAYDKPFLGSGERAAIAAVLARGALKGALVVSDDMRARRAFGGVRFAWTEEMLDAMMARGIIGRDTYNLRMSKLENSSFYSRGRGRGAAQARRRPGGPVGRAPGPDARAKGRT